MLKTIYVVTAGNYSDYHIEAIFEDEAKAEYYCTCHENCEIEEYGFSDERIFTPFNSVVINFTIRKNEKDEIDFTFKHLSKEDGDFYLKNRDEISVYDHDWVILTLYRRLPDKYDEQKIRDKYTKVYQDLRAEILYIASETDCSSYENEKIAEEYIQKYIEGRFGIENTDE